MRGKIVSFVNFEFANGGEYEEKIVSNKKDSTFDILEVAEKLTQEKGPLIVMMSLLTPI